MMPSSELRVPSSELEELCRAEAIILQWSWKTPAMKAMTLAVCRLALERGARGTEFSANDLPDFAHGGAGIAGAIFQRLARDGVLAPVLVWDGTSYSQKYVRNAGGNRIGLWRLANAALARRALEVHGQPEPELKQTNFALS